MRFSNKNNYYGNDDDKVNNNIYESLIYHEMHSYEVKNKFEFISGFFF